MKKLAMIILLSGILSGNAVAANSNQKSTQDDCSCGNCPTSTTQGSVFQPLFPEYELKPPLGG